MPGAKWTTIEQEAWLSAYYEEHYVPCMPSRNYTDFKPVFHEAWFKFWPERAVFRKKLGLDPSQPLTPAQESELGDAIEVCKEQLIVWMRWRANKSRREREGAKTKPFLSLQSLITKPKTTRKLTEEEVFSKLFYDTRIKSVFEDECKKQGLERGDKKARMELRRKLTKEGWQAASQDEEVRKKVVEEKARREAQPAEVGAEENVNAGQDDKVVDKKMVSNVVADMPAMFRDLLRSLQDQTGWSFSLLAGGPDFTNGTQKTKTFSVHIGETALGMNFVQSYPAFSERVLKPFELFVRYIHGEYFCI
ncbi:hypothetical protein EV363DRAFT_1169520 [Boletus edulis]|nr:hypothetical protein EV363DRAFT_1169520 [Boletus edulis]